MTSIEEELYRENIIEHYKNPQNKGVLEPHDAKERGVNPNCGDMLTMYIQKENGKIKDISFEGQGCAISIAGASMLTEFVKGKKLSDVADIKEGKVFELLGVNVNPAREKCALLAFNTIQKLV